MSPPLGKVCSKGEVGTGYTVS